MTRHHALPLLAAIALGCGAEPSSVETRSQAITGCEPGPNEVSVFFDAHYAGSCVNLGMNEGFRGSYFSISDATGFPNDVISSVKLGSNVFGMFTKDTAFRGWRFDADSSYLYVGSIFNDSFTSAIIQTWDRYCADPNWRPGVGQVALYADSGFGNTCLVITSTDDIGNGPGNLLWGSAGLLHLNYQTSSIRVGPRTRVHVGRNGYPGGGGPEEEFDRDVFDLTGTIVGNDTITFARVWVP